jgi:uncharacterized protein with HEPN domain
VSRDQQLRNVVDHGYFKEDFEIAWKTSHNDLPDLFRQVKAIWLAS